MLNKIIATLITVGGAGYINYFVANQLSAVESIGDKKTSQIAYSLIWSIVDFSFFLFLQQNLKGHLHGETLLIICMLVTLVFSFLISLLLAKPLQKLSYFLYGIIFKVYKENNGINPGSVWDDFLSGQNEIEAYCYDLQHNPIGQGFITAYSKIPGKHDFVLQPFKEEKHKKQWSYDEIEEISQNPGNWDNFTIRQYINVQENLIIFTIRK